jgi:hypothetical protein
MTCRYTVGAQLARQDLYQGILYARLGPGMDLAELYRLAWVLLVSDI